MKEKRQLRTYDHISQLPATMDQRTCTDVFCLILGVSFTVIMLIVATACYNHGISFYNTENYLKSNFPADSDGSLCGFDFPQYQYLYFANLPQINQRICVQSCPKPDDKTLKCSPTNDIGCKIGNGQKFTAKYYESQPLQTRGGFFCWPTSPQLQQQINSRTNLQQRNVFYNSIDTIKIGIIIAFVVSVIYFFLVQFLAFKMNYIVVGLGMVVLLVTIICVFTYNTHLEKQKIIVGTVLTLILVFFAVTVYKHSDSMKLYSIYLKWSTKMYNDRQLSITYILLFFAILLGFIGIMIWEFTGFWSAGNINFDPNTQIYHQLSGTFPSVMTFFMFVQLIWGLSFVKEACTYFINSVNFCISGNAAHWFLQENKGDDHPNVIKNVWHPAILLVRKHLGTVIAGAFMTGFFGVLDAIFDTLRPKQTGGNEIYRKIFGKACFFCTEIFDFVRSDSLAFVNLAGNPYCNSSRYCEMLCRKSVTTQYSQSSSRVYRLSAHILLMGIVGVITLYLNGKISIYAELLILIETIFISTLFISYHSDSAEAIQIILLTIQELYFVRHRVDNQKNHNEDLLLLKKENIRVQLIEQIAQERNRQRENQNKNQ